MPVGVAPGNPQAKQVVLVNAQRVLAVPALQPQRCCSGITPPPSTLGAVYIARGHGTCCNLLSFHLPVPQFPHCNNWNRINTFDELVNTGGFLALMMPTWQIPSCSASPFPTTFLGGLSH